MGLIDKYELGPERVKMRVPRATPDGMAGFGMAGFGLYLIVLSFAKPTTAFG